MASWRVSLPTAPADVATRVGTDLLRRWGEAHRQYHTVSHLEAVLSVIEQHHSHAADLAAVRLAAWYHDAVYDPQRVDNEEVSAQLAETALPSLGVPAEQVAEVARLVRLTAGHDPAPGDRNGELITDADLCVLAAPPEVYQAYTAAVRREYAHVPDPLFAAGRAAVLRNLLSLSPMFRTPALRERWEEAARVNITRELAELSDEIAEFARKSHR
jgi:predicted metal-dependent HD superfamily phosphohydrolase